LVFYYFSPDHRDLPSFPTRRSSDLSKDAYECRGRRHVVLVRIQRIGNGSLRRLQYFVAVDGRDLGGRQRGTLATGRVYRARRRRSEEHTSELQSRSDLVCRLLLEKK